MFSQCCHNVVTCCHMFSQCCHNVVTMLSQCCHMLSHVVMGTEATVVICHVRLELQFGDV